MRLVADENVPMKAVLLLREKGHDVLSISESLPQTADEDILKTAERDGSHNPQLQQGFWRIGFLFRTSHILWNNPFANTIAICRLSHDDYR